jgi:hypothetical protein
MSLRKLKFRSSLAALASPVLTLSLPLCLSRLSGSLSPQLSRNEYLTGKVIDNIEDEPDDDEVAGSLSTKANYAVL